jgi:hypothetical protein
VQPVLIEPGAENFPFPQGRHAVPLSLAYVDPGHGAQNSDPSCVDAFPAPHGMHWEMFPTGTGVYVPFGQGEQLLEPTAAKWPGSQAVQKAAEAAPT